MLLPNPVTQEKKVRKSVVFPTQPTRNFPPKTYTNFVPGAALKSAHLVFRTEMKEPKAQIFKANAIAQSAEKDEFFHIWVFGCLS